MEGGNNHGGCGSDQGVAAGGRTEGALIRWREGVTVFYEKHAAILLIIDKNRNTTGN
jgi:hypothetical protein